MSPLSGRVLFGVIQRAVLKSLKVDELKEQLSVEHNIPVQDVRLTKVSRVYTRALDVHVC